MTNRIAVRYTLPAHFASYLVNGDDSGLDASEHAALDAYLATEGLMAGDCITCSDDEWFAWHNDMTNLGGTVAEFIFERPATGEEIG